MGNNQPVPRKIVLLGDSTIDNGRWTAGPCVHDQVKQSEPNTVLCARDGALIAAIASQLKEAPPGTHYIVSVGGNNGTEGINVLGERIADCSVENGARRLARFARDFEVEYTEMVRSLVQQVGNKPVVLCSVYNPCFSPFQVNTTSQEAANVGVALLADAVTRVAARFGLPVIDWRRVMTDAEDFANPIEPSSKGGQKIADTIVNVVRNHPFGSKCSIVYPQAYPSSVLVQCDETETDDTNESKRNNSARKPNHEGSSAAVVADIRPIEKYLPHQACS